MSTAEKAKEKAEEKAGHGAAWANLIICGGLSWGVNLWHATHATSTGAHVATGLALLCATGPVVSAGFASHNMARSGGGKFKMTMTYLVFAMGMALSITAQAEAVEDVFGTIYLGVTFALMLDLSAFMSLHSIMTTPAAETSTEASVEASGKATAAPSGGHVIQCPADTAGDTVRECPADTRTDASADTPRTPPADTPKDARRTHAKASPRTPAKAAKPAAVDTRTKARELLKANPDMNAAELAQELKRKPAGSIRTMRTELLEELRDAGELPSVRALGA